MPSSLSLITLARLTELAAKSSFLAALPARKRTGRLRECPR
jgi:hypothetical protein